MQIIDNEIAIPSEGEGALFRFYRLVGLKPMIYWCRTCDWTFIGVPPLDVVLLHGLQRQHDNHVIEIMEELHELP